MGIGKYRTAYGRYLDRNGILQERVREVSGLNRETVSKACSEAGYVPGASTARKLLAAVRTLTGNDVEFTDFWRL